MPTCPPYVPDVRVVARWRSGTASCEEVAALRRLIPELRDRPIAEVFREVRASPEWVLAICEPWQARRVREEAERAGLLVVVEPVGSGTATAVTTSCSPETP